MPVTNNLRIWSSSGSNTMDDATYSSANQRINGVQASEVISSNIHNTTLKSVTTLLSGLVTALLTNVPAVVGSNFTTNMTLANAETTFTNLFAGLTVANVLKWNTARSFKISDGTNNGTPVNVDGSGNVTLLLPTTIIADIVGDVTGTASNASHINGKTFDMVFDANTGILDITYITPQE